MKKCLLAFAITLSCASCGIKMIPLKGSYPRTPIVYNTASDYETVWSKLIDLFAEVGIGIKIIDKASGLIVTEPVNFADAWTFELKDGSLKNPKAWLVVQKYKNQSDNKYYIPNTILANWNARIKKTAEGTSVNINITNMKTMQVLTSPYGSTTERNVSVDVRTTGVFEKLIYDKIK